MKDVKRYDVMLSVESDINTGHYLRSFPTMSFNDNGRWVDWVDYSELRFEMQELKEANQELKNKIKSMQKVGDDMAKALGKIKAYNPELNRYMSPCEPELLEDWLSAKNEKRN